MQIQLGPFFTIPLATLATLFLIIIVSSLPLYIAVKLLGGRVSLLKVFLVNIIVAIVVPAVSNFAGFFSGIIAFILMLLVYKVFFRIGWIRALLAWLLQGFFVGLMIWVLITLGLFL